MGVQTPFAVYVGQDAKQATRYIAYVSQSGLGLPDRDYYFKQEPRFAETRAAYLTYIETLLGLAGEKDPAGAAKAILALETSLAEKHWDRVRNRDREATYNLKSVAELEQLTPGFAWTRYLKALDAEKTPGVIVRQPDYFQAMSAVLAQTPLPTLKQYLTFKVLDEMRAPAQLPVRAGRVRLPRQDAPGPPGEPPPLEARRGDGGRRAGRGARQALRGAPLQPPEQGPHAGAGEEPARRLREGHRPARVDEPRHQDPGQGEAGQVQREDRLPGEVAGLLLAHRQPRRPGGQREARRRVRRPPQRQQAGQAHRPARVGHDAADGECLLQLDDERDRLPGRHPPASLLQPRGG